MPERASLPGLPVQLHADEAVAVRIRTAEGRRVQHLGLFDHVVMNSTYRSPRRPRPRHRARREPRHRPVDEVPQLVRRHETASIFSGFALRAARARDELVPVPFVLHEALLA